MAPFSQARATQFLYEQQDGTAVFRAEIDVQWSVFGNPHGGYLLAVLVDALSQHQRESKPHHPDPAHLMTQFLQGTKPGKAEVHVKVIHTGKSWTNLTASLVQNSQTIITSQALYTLFPSLPTDPLTPFSTAHQTLLPLTPSAYAPLTPFLTHPAQCDPHPTEGRSTEQYRRWSDKSVFFFLPERMRWAEDEGIKKRREKGEGQGGRLKLEWGAWCEFVDEGERVDAGSLPFWADMMSSIPELLPPGQRITPHYYPTLAISLHFHTKLPLTPTCTPYLSAPQTVGCYSLGDKILNGRHEQLVEIWSAPGPLGKGQVQEDWQKRCVPLLTSTQIALSVDTSKLVARKVKEGEPKL